MKRYSVCLRYEVDTEIEDIEAENEEDAVKIAKSKVDRDLEEYIFSARYRGVLDIEPR